LAIALSVDPEAFAARLWCKVNLASFVLLIDDLSTKLKDIPTWRPTCNTAQKIAKMLCQGCFCYI